MGGYRPVFARISPDFGGSPSQWLGRAWISRHPVEIRVVLGVGWVGLCGGMTACVGRTYVGEGRVPTRLRSDLALFCGIPLAVAREGLDLATSGRDPSGFGGWLGRVVRRYDGLRAPSTWEMGGFRPVFARISPDFAGSPSPWLGRAWISRHPVEIQAVSGAGGGRVVRRYDGLVRAPSTWEMGRYRPVFARILPYFAGSP